MATTQQSARSLKQGHRGPAVKELQQVLIDKGLMPAEDSGQPNADGLFGAETRRAVQQFQKDNGLTPDGVVGEKTAQLLKVPLPTRPPVEMPGERLLSDEQRDLLAEVLDRLLPPLPLLGVGQAIEALDGPLIRLAVDHLDRLLARYLPPELARALGDASAGLLRGDMSELRDTVVNAVITAVRIPGVPAAFQKRVLTMIVDAIFDALKLGNRLDEVVERYVKDFVARQ